MLNIQYIQLIYKKVCVYAPARDHFNCFRIPAESTLNTYCLINNHWIKVCFYLCTLAMNAKLILYLI